MENQLCWGTNGDKLFWKQYASELQRSREVLAVASAFCVSYTDKMVEMFCETQEPRRMVFKVKNFSNDGDKTWSGHKMRLQYFSFYSGSVLAICRLKQRNVQCSPKLGTVLMKIVTSWWDTDVKASRLHCQWFSSIVTYALEYQWKESRGAL